MTEDLLDCRPGSIIIIRDTAASLFAQLREMGVLCGTCRKRVGHTMGERGCRHSLRFSHVCGAWEPSPPD